MAKASFQLDDETEEKVEDRMTYGQSKSAWYRYAVETVTQVEPILDDVCERYDYDERKQFIETAVRNEVERREDGESE